MSTNKSHINTKVPLATLLSMSPTRPYTYNQKDSANHDRLHFYVQIHWKCDAKEVSISEHFTD